MDQSITPSRPATLIKVAVNNATSRSWPPLSAKTSLCASANVRPALITLPRDQALAYGRRNEIDLEFRGQDTAISGHHLQSCITCRRIGNRTRRSGVNESVLLGDLRARDQRNLDLAGRYLDQRRAQSAHQPLLVEAGADTLPGAEAHRLKPPSITCVVPVVKADSSLAR
ncbi:MAG: hypothetical protein KGQ37_06020 [Hyphomicrobiales bacterium]|nr:hypothetical protein [Hyphomicrobiales bacterium]